jgi:hypothetical protein
MSKLVEKYIDWQIGACSQSDFLIECYEAGLDSGQIAEVEREGELELWAMGIGSM